MRSVAALAAGLVVGCAARRAPLEGYASLQEPAAAAEVQLVISGDTDAEPVAAPGTDIHLWGAFNVHDHESVIAARADEVVARSTQAGLLVSEGDGELPAEDDVMWFSARLLSAE